MPKSNAMAIKAENEVARGMNSFASTAATVWAGANSEAGSRRLPTPSSPPWFPRERASEED
jgi:hypothetical protein